MQSYYLPYHDVKLRSLYAGTSCQFGDSAPVPLTGYVPETTENLFVLLIQVSIHA